MSEGKIDELLVKQVLTGDEEAFNILVRKYRFKLQQSVLRYVHDPEDASDVIQETFIRAYRALDHFRGDSVFYTWIYRIAVNTAKNYIKSKDRRPPNIDIDIEDAVHTSNYIHLEENQTPEEVVISNEMQNALIEVLNQLPENLKASILLREMGGLSYEEIAEMLDVPIGTIRSRIFRARACIEEQLKPLK